MRKPIVSKTPAWLSRDARRCSRPRHSSLSRPRRAGERLTRFGPFSSQCRAAATSATTDTRGIYRRDPQLDIVVLLGHSNGVWSAAFSHDGSRIVTASIDKTTRIWDAATAQEIAVLLWLGWGMRGPA